MVAFGSVVSGALALIVLDWAVQPAGAKGISGVVGWADSALTHLMDPAVPAIGQHAAVSAGAASLTAPAVATPAATTAGNPAQTPVST